MIAITVAGVAAQQPPASYEVVSIKRNTTAGTPLLRNVVWMPGDRMQATALTLADLIRSAYVGDGIQLTSQIVGGPAWGSTERFDVVAKLTGIIQTGNPDDVNRQRRAALKAILADRFRLEIRMERQEMPVFDLVRAGGEGAVTKMIPSTCGLNGSRPCGTSRFVKMDPAVGITLAYEGMTMEQLAGALVSSPVIMRPIRNRTGLSGAFDLQFTMPMAAGERAQAEAAIFTALQEQLGLKLEGRRDLADVLVIDNAGPPTDD